MTAEEDLAAKKAQYGAVNARREAYAQASRERAAVKRAENNERVNRANEERKAQREAAIVDKRQEQADALKASCEAGKEERRAERIKIEESRHIKELMQDWEAEHCKSIDASKEVTRVVQDSRGEYHTVAGRDRGVDLVCDAKKPEPLAAAKRAHWMIIYRPPQAMWKELNRCESVDEETK